jgi:hypothetical protein
MEYYSEGYVMEITKLEDGWLDFEIRDNKGKIHFSEIAKNIEQIDDLLTEFQDNDNGINTFQRYFIDNWENIKKEWCN